MGGKRGCALKLALFLNVIGWLALVAGCVTPYWSRIVDETSGDVQQHHGLLVSHTPGGSWTFLDFNQFQDGESCEGGGHCAGTGNGDEVVVVVIVAIVSMVFVVLLLLVLLTWRNWH